MCVPLLLNFCLISQWRQCLCKCVKLLSLCYHFNSFGGDYWSIFYSTWLKSMFQRKSAVLHPELNIMVWHKEKSSWVGWEFNSLFIYLFLYCYDHKYFKLLPADLFFYYTFTLCFKTTHHLKAEPCTFDVLHQNVFIVLILLPHPIFICNMLWYFAFACFSSFHRHLIYHLFFGNPVM